MNGLDQKDENSRLGFTEENNNERSTRTHESKIPARVGVASVVSSGL